MVDGCIEEFLYALSLQRVTVFRSHPLKTCSKAFEKGRGKGKKGDDKGKCKGKKGKCKGKK